MRAWTFQDPKQLAKHGDKCPWSVGWYDPDGQRRQKRIGSHSMAVKFQRKKEGELAAGLCRTGPEQVTWAKFREEYAETVMPKWRSAESRYLADRAFDVFEELIDPKYVSRVDERSLDTFVAKRLKMRGKKKGETIAAETVKKEIRTIRAALTYAVRWKYLVNVPAKPEVDGYGKDKPFVTEEHFEGIMGHCGAARLPQDQNYTAEDFWRALLATVWVTGMRRSALLAILWDDTDLDGGILVSRGHENKQKRDQRHHIGPVVEILRALYSVRQPWESRVFPWNHALKSLDRDLHRIQAAAGIHLHCGEDHEHTEACHYYGFHSFRYAHATYNFGRVTDRELQEQMGHASFNTTQHYIKYAETHQQKAYDAYLPESLRTKTG